MICRFFAGFVGAAPLVVAPAVMADMFNNRTRGTAITIFAMLLFGGPMLAPILGGFTVKNSAWDGDGRPISVDHWLFGARHEYIHVGGDPPSFGFGSSCRGLRRRQATGDICPHEEVTLNMKEIAKNNVARPIKMLFTEPILLLISLYNSFIYGMLYLFLTAFH
ncbi:putative transporter C36.02c [Candida viswanathii]|uniref:Putative transporter C36.02c n=1 Tax=Candida viswanathii TaxID=5486 RepID=A0A367YIP7_9ASCO|nr:putative transporter C36.02c [Candida viswanathii]